ncbi:MAG: AI-2E family transporter [Micropruina sp.]
MTSQPDEEPVPEDPGPTPTSAATPRPSPTPTRPRGWLHRLRRATQPTPPDLDPDVFRAGPRVEVNLAKRSPFAIGFFITLGALTAGGLVFGLYRIANIVLLVMLALYLALGLNPLVDRLSSRGLRRGVSVLLVVLAALGVWPGHLGGLSVATEQLNRLMLNAPELLRGCWPADRRVRRPLRRDQPGERRSSSGELFRHPVRGLWGAGQAVLGILFSTVITHRADRTCSPPCRRSRRPCSDLAPASRRPRVQYLAGEMFRVHRRLRDRRVHRHHLRHHWWPTCSSTWSASASTRQPWPRWWRCARSSR